MTTVVITGGGTSGHVLPAIAIAEMLEERGVDPADIHFVGTVRGIDGRLLGDTEYPYTLLPVTGLRRSAKPPAIAANMGMVLRQFAARRRCIALLREPRPDVVVSVGGYGSLAAMHAARRLGIRTVVVSYDSRPGLATRRQAAQLPIRRRRSSARWSPARPCGAQFVSSTGPPNPIARGGSSGFRAMHSSSESSAARSARAS